MGQTCKEEKLSTLKKRRKNEGKWALRYENNGSFAIAPFPWHLATQIKNLPSLVTLAGRVEFVHIFGFLTSKSS